MRWRRSWGRWRGPGHGQRMVRVSAGISGVPVRATTTPSAPPIPLPASGAEPLVGFVATTPKRCQRVKSEQAQDMVTRGYGKQGQRRASPGDACVYLSVLLCSCCRREADVASRKPGTPAPTPSAPLRAPTRGFVRETHPPRFLPELL